MALAERRPRSCSPTAGAVRGRRASGPGLGRAAGTPPRSAASSPRSPGPLVVDADGLHALAGHLDLLAGPAGARGPHPARGRVRGAPGGAGGRRPPRRGPGARRRVRRGRAPQGPRHGRRRSSGRAAICPLGGPWLASAGTGDVLTGIVAAFLARGSDAVRSRGRRGLRPRGRRRRRRAYWPRGRGPRGRAPRDPRRARRGRRDGLPARVGHRRSRRHHGQRRARSPTLAAPAALLATVKADAYGHGAVPVARAALDAGATWLGVAFVEEGIELREAGIDAPILLLSEPPPAAAPVVVARRLTPFVYTRGGIDALGAAATAAGTTLPVHLKVDTGMHRVGCTPAEAVALAERIAADGGLVLEGMATHLAVADEADRDFTEAQLDAFDAAIEKVTAAVGRPPDRPRGQLGRGAGVPAGPLRPRAGRHHPVRHRPVPGGGGPRGPAPGALAARPGVVREEPARRRPGVVRSAVRAAPSLAHRDRARRVRRRCAPGARGNGGSGAGGRPTVPDRGDGDDGPAAGRRRRPGRPRG